MSTLLLMMSMSSLAQKKKEPINRILFIFDASHSMNGEWQSGSKIDIAKKLLNNLLDSLVDFQNLEIGLRIYGNKSNYQIKDCEDTHLEVNFLKPDSALKLIKGKLHNTKAIGTTPIARSLELGATKDFLFYEKESRNIVILITDGKESCEMDPCAVSRLYQRKGIILKPFIVGVGLFDASWKESFDCVGRFFDASNEKDFANVLNLIISHVIHNTTLQINLLDEDEEPIETNINLSFYDEFNGLEKYNYVHKISNKNSDTMTIDPVSIYKIVAHTIPPVVIRNVILKPGKHTVIDLKTPQGTLNITMAEKQNYPCIIRESGSSTTLNVQKVNTSEQYLIGKYDVEVLSLPRRIYNNIEIKKGIPSTLKLPPPALVNIKLPSNGYGGVYVKDGDDLNQIYHFKAEKTQHRLTLLPGNYKLVFRAEKAKNYIYTTEKSFKLKSGQSEHIKIY